MSACTKLKEHHSQAHRRRLKQLLKIALFVRNLGRQIAATLGELARKTRGKKLKKKIVCEKFTEHHTTAQRGRPKHLQITPLFGLNEDRQIAVIVHKTAKNIEVRPNRDAHNTHGKEIWKKKRENAKKMQKMATRNATKMQKLQKKHAKNAKKTQKM